MKPTLSQKVAKVKVEFARALKVLGLERDEIQEELDQWTDADWRRFVHVFELIGKKQ